MRQMRLSDLSEVMEISRRSLPRPWSEGVWREELESPYGLYLVLLENGTVSGYVGTKRVADELHIMTIAVRPEKRWRGSARTLLRSVLSDPASEGAARIHLEVRLSNLKARALYESLGFVQTGVRRRYYGDEDALLMTLRLREVPS